MSPIRFLAVFGLLFVNPALASRVSELSSSVWMRDVSASLQELCAGAHQDCFTTHYAVDPYRSDESAMRALKEGIAKDNFLKLKFALVETGRWTETFREMWTEAETPRNASTEATFRLLTERLKHLRHEQTVTVLEAIGYGSALQQRYVIVFLKNPRFDMGEALVFGVGERAKF